MLGWEDKYSSETNRHDKSGHTIPSYIEHRSANSINIMFEERMRYSPPEAEDSTGN
jgi:hypothetical protein